ncbi:MAG: PQQ-binding-like beta-propeller repeat protein [Parafilimonas sp.]|nr:PQQ-binding-like beta-propeller repeat protein [Parafilimonas sp.]
MKKFPAFIVLCFVLFSCKKDEFSVTRNSSVDNNTEVNNGFVYIAEDMYPPTIYALDANSGSIRWQYKNDTDYERFSPIPCVANNTVFTEIYSLGFPEFSDGKLLFAAFNAHTGKQRWVTVLNPSASIVPLSNPTFYNNTIYVTAQKKLYAINADNGKVKWKLICDSGTSNNPICSPTVVNGIIYTGNRQHLFALNANNGSIIWQRNADLSNSTPTVLNGVISFTDRTDGTVTAFDTAGNLKWKFNKAGYLTGSTTTNNSFIYQGIGYPMNEFTAFALRNTDGAVKWNYTQPVTPTVNNGLCGDPSYYGNTIYYALTDSLLAISTTGAHNKKWSYFTGIPADSTFFSTSSPVAGRNIVYVMTKGMIVYALNERNGELIWQFDTHGENPVYSPVILYNDGTAIHPAGSGMTQ